MRLLKPFKPSLVILSLYMRFDLVEGSALDQLSLVKPLQEELVQHPRSDLDLKG